MTSLPKEVKVEIEYCNVCDFKRQCQELQEFLNKSVPEAKIECKSGRRGSFEVKINENLVHSKLQTIAFPDYEDVALNVRNCLKGIPISKVKEQKITECSLM